MGPNGRAANRPNGSDGRSAPDGPVRSGAVLDLCNCTDSAVAVVPAGSPRGTGHERGSGHAEPGRAEPSRGTGGTAGRGWTRRVGPDTGDSRAGGTPRLGGISWITRHVGPCRMGNGYTSVSQAVAPEVPARVGVLAPLRLREYSAAARRHVPPRVPRWDYCFRLSSRRLSSSLVSPCLLRFRIRRSFHSFRSGRRCLQFGLSVLSRVPVFPLSMIHKTFPSQSLFRIP